MFTIQTYNYDCSKKCKNTEHGRIIVEAIKRTRVSDLLLAAFIAKTCRNFYGVTDEAGFTALHATVGTGRYAIAEWLIFCGSLITTKDKITGSTPLHYAILNRRIDMALLLQRHGASLDNKDRNHVYPQNICSHRSRPVVSMLKETYVWGSNKNYNLGIGNQEEERQYPQQLDFFTKQNIFLKKIAITSFHCLFLDEQHRLYSVGHGNSCQLGIGKEGTLVEPQLIKISLKKQDFVSHISAARYHSLILTAKNLIFSCGLNSNYQLGYQHYVEKEMKFREVSFNHLIPSTQSTSSSAASFFTTNTPISYKFQGIIAMDFYSIAYTDKLIYIWGRNGGQFGIKPDIEIVQMPQKIESYGHRIQLVSASNAAIATYTNQNVILLYYKYKIRTIKMPTHEQIRSITVAGGEFGAMGDDVGNTTAATSTSATNNNPNNSTTMNASTNSSCTGKQNDVLRILIRTATGQIYIWYEDCKQYLRCYLPLSDKIEKNNPIRLFGGDNNDNSLIFVANGNVFSGKSKILDIPKNRNRHPDEYQELISKKDLLSSTKEIIVELTRISYLNDVRSIHCDPAGKSFVAMLNHSRRYLNVNKIKPEELSFKNLMTEASEFDGIHDIIFHIEDEQFPAHKYLIFSRAPGFKNYCANERHVYLNFENFSSKMFELMLKYIYSNHMLTMADVEDIEVSLNPLSGYDNLEVYTVFREHAGRFGMSKFAGSIVVQGDYMEKQSIRLKREQYPDLYDIKLLCANNREIQAHKCVLVARMEYFHLMFSNSWSETKTVNFTTLPIEYLEPIIEFLYTNDDEHIWKQNYSDNFLYNMLIICDQYFINQLRQIFESIIIDRMSTKKCAEMLEFACDYNCKLLKRACLDFMTINMARLLEMRSLDGCDASHLELIQQNYQTDADGEFGSIEPPSQSDILHDVMLESFVADFQVDLTCKWDDELNMRKSKQLKKERTISGSNSAKQERKLYEKQAIEANKLLSAMMDVSPGGIGSGGGSTSKTESSPLNEEAQKISEELQSKAKNWTKVTSDRKDVKKKLILSGLKSNDILLSEEKDKDTFVTLSKLNLGPKTSSTGSEIQTEINMTLQSSQLRQENSLKEPIDENIESSSSLPRSTINLASFTPQKSTKLSQKQRKSLEKITPTKLVITSNDLTTAAAIVSPIVQQVVENCWAIKSPTLTTTPITPTEPINIPSGGRNQSGGGDCSIFNLSSSAGASGSISPFSMRSQKIKKSGVVSSLDNVPEQRTMDANSFTRILKEEKREKEYYEKLKTKSLVLTQIEETAIDELKRFYNIDNVHDENIYIERAAHIKPKMNFAVWHQ